MRVSSNWYQQYESILRTNYKVHILNTIFLILIFTASAQCGSPEWLNVKDFGAIGDGIKDDTNAITATINKSGENASTIYFPRGIYRCGKISLRSDRMLRGEDAKLVCIDNLNKIWIEANHCNNIKIENLIFDGNKSHNTYNITEFKPKYASDLLSILDCTNIRIVDCSFLDAADSSLMLSQSRNCRIINNYFDGAWDVAIYVNNDWNLRGDKDANALGDCIISGNVITNCPFGGIALKRVSRRIIVSNNIIHHCGNGITLENGSSTWDYSKDILINGNFIRYIGNWPDQPWQSPLITKRNAYVAGYGINLRCSDYSIVTNNKIEDCYNYSIWIAGSRYCTIGNNLIKGSDVKTQENLQIGIALTALKFNVIDVNIAAYFKPDNFDKTTGTCLVKSTFCSISGNVVTDHKNYGISEEKDGAEHNVFTGNVCVKNIKNWQMSVGTSLMGVNY